MATRDEVLQSIANARTEIAKLHSATERAKANNVVAIASAADAIASLQWAQRSIEALRGPLAEIETSIDQIAVVLTTVESAIEEGGLLPAPFAMWLAE